MLAYVCMRYHISLYVGRSVSLRFRSAHGDVGRCQFVTCQLHGRARGDRDRLDTHPSKHGRVLVFLGSTCPVSHPKGCRWLNLFLCCVRFHANSPGSSLSLQCFRHTSLDDAPSLCLWLRRLPAAYALDMWIYWIHQGGPSRLPQGARL